MAWTQTIVSKEVVDGAPIINVEFTDGTTNFVQKFSANNIATLKQLITNKLKDLSDSDTFIAGLPDGAFDATITTTPLTQAEIDRNTWIAKYTKLVRAKTTLVDTGVITAAQPTYAALLSDVKAGLKAEYLDFI